MRWMALFVVLLFSCGDAADSINAVTGDRSWRELRDSEPGAATENERIEVHLQWVEAELRARDVSALQPSVRRNRQTLLGVLRAYRKAGVFPRHSIERPGPRGPRWVDDRGVRCAVAQLVSASGRDELVAQVQRKHEYDYVPDIDVPELHEWAVAHGFTATELAMIQPTYDHGDVDWPPRKRREVQRPMQVEDVPAGWYTVQMKQECVDEPGTWVIESKVSVGADLEGVVRVRVTRDGQPDPVARRCFARAQRRLVREHVTAKKYRVQDVLSRTTKETLLVPAEDEVSARFFASIDERTARLERLRECTKNWPEGLNELPFAFAIRGGKANAWLHIDQAAYKQLPTDQKERWQCLASALVFIGWGKPAPLHDTYLGAVLKRNGTIQPADVGEQVLAGKPWLAATAADPTPANQDSQSPAK